MKKTTFGKWLQAKRKQAKYSQRSMAQALGISHAYLSKIEAGVLPAPSTDTLWKMGVLLGVSTVTMHLEAGKVPPCLKSAFENGIVSEAEYYRIMESITGRGA